MSALKFKVPSLTDIRVKIREGTSRFPHVWQCNDCIAQLEGKDVITIAPTGSGKTLTFWMPLFFNDNGITIIITALNILGDQNVADLGRLGISAVNVTGESATDEVFKDIEACKHRVIVVSPEKILKDDRFERLWESKKFMSKLFNVGIDEGHCISQWGKEFRPEYADLGRLRFILPSHVKFHVVSATMPDKVLDDVKRSLNMRNETTVIIRRSNDRPNIHLMVEEMKYSPKGILDIERILRLHVLEADRPPKFMIFANKRKETEKGVEELWKQLLPELHDKIIWFHSGMSEEFREEAIMKLREGTVWGFWCTDAAGMGLDLPDIELVIQWRYCASLCTLMQRMGRGGRGAGTEATGIYLVEPQYFDHAKKKVIGVKRKGKGKGKKGAKKQKNTHDSEKEASSSATSETRVQEPSDTIPEEGESGDEDDEDENENDGQGEDGTNAPVDLTREVEAPAVQPLWIPPVISSLVELPSPIGLDESEYEALIMDMFINARAIKNDSDDGVCCERCKQKASRLCCDVCNSAAFLILSLRDPPPKATRVKRKAKFDNYTMDSHDNKLLRGLHKWRHDQAVLDGLDLNDIFGEEAVVVDDILEEIVVLAHHFKVPNIDALAAQTKWRDAYKYGSAILQVTRQFYPPDPPQPSNPSTSLLEILLPGTVFIQDGPQEPSTQRQKRQCKGCGSFEHIATNRLCPNHSSKLLVSDENALPQSSTRPVASRKCGACHAPDHIASSKKCPLWKPVEERRKQRLPLGTRQPP